MNQYGFSVVIGLILISLVTIIGLFYYQENKVSSVLGTQKQVPLQGNSCISSEQCGVGEMCQQPQFCPIFKKCIKNPNTFFCQVQQALCNGTCVVDPSYIPPESAVENLPFMTGVNMRGVIHYGYKDILPYSQKSSIDASLQEVKDMGGDLVRVFVGNRHISSGEAARRLDEFLIKAKQYDIHVIPVLIDLYDSGFSPKGTEKYYYPPYSYNSVLGRDFFDKGYLDYYLEFMDTVVWRNMHHTNIFAWEPGNELKYDPEPELFIQFMEDISRRIKDIDPYHRISTGMIGASHAALSPDQLYPRLTQFDVITIHPYDGDRSNLEDIQWAKRSGKVGLIEEIGISSGDSNRSTRLQSEIEFWKEAGATGVLHWGFVAKDLTDNGDGDQTYGMDNFIHDDYEQISNIFFSFDADTPTCDWEFRYPECDWNTGFVHDVYQHSCSGEYKWENIHYQAGVCGN